MKVKSESEVSQSCPTLSDPMDCSLPGSSIHGIFQARVLKWGAIAFSVEGARRTVFEVRRALGCEVAPSAPRFIKTTCSRLGLSKQWSAY